MSWLLVFVGGGTGAALRHGVNLAAFRLLGPGWPAGTFIVNVAGSLAMGLLIGWLARHDVLSGGGSNELRLALTTGLLGGFTTFSAFSLDAVALWERGAVASAAIYVLASVVLSIVAMFVGLSLARP